MIGVLGERAVDLVVVDDLEITNVAVLLHHLQELHDHLARRPDHDLALAALLGVGNALQAIRLGFVALGRFGENVAVVVLEPPAECLCLRPALLGLAKLFVTPALVVCFISCLLP